MEINLNKHLVGGDKRRAMVFIGPANSQMELLRRDMSFQGLKQGVRRVWLHKDVYIECRKVFNYQECRIWVAPKTQLQKREEALFAFIVSTYSEDKAFVWDPVNDELLYECDSLVNITDAIEADGFTPKVQLQPDGEWSFSSGGGLTTDLPGNLPDSLHTVLWFINSFTGTVFNAVVPYNPDINSWNYEAYIEYEVEDYSPTGAYFAIFEEAIQPSGPELEDWWQVGDWFKFSTERGTDTIDFIDISSNGMVDFSKVYGDVLGSIDETWTIEIVQGAQGVDRCLYISGETVGNIYDGGAAGPLSQKVWTDTTPGLEYLPYSASAPVDYVKYIQDPDADPADDPDDHRNANFFFRTADGFNGNVGWDSIFESLSGQSWPVPAESIPDENFLVRERFFYNSVFGTNMSIQSETAYAGEMKALCVHLYDSFISGDWSRSAISEIPSEDEGDPGTYQYLTNAGETIWAEDRFDRAFNRPGGVQLLGRADSYEPVNEDDLTEPLAKVVFDAFRFDGPTMQTGLYLHYKLPNPLGGKAKEAFDGVNAEREGIGLPPLVYNPKLQESSLRFARDIAENQIYLETTLDLKHRGSDGSEFYERIEDTGYCYPSKGRFLEAWMGENMGMITSPPCESDYMVALWKSSFYHWKNISSPNFTEAGMAVIREEGTDRYCFCQNFGGKPGTWPGYVTMDSEKIESYMLEVFETDDLNGNDEFLKVYVTQKEEVTDGMDR